MVTPGTCGPTEDANLNRFFHEAAHAVAAVRMGMLQITIRDENRKSERSAVSTDANITYSCLLFDGESTLDMLRRKLCATLAGPAWEAVSNLKVGVNPKDEYHSALKAQRDDDTAVAVIRNRLGREANLLDHEIEQIITEVWHNAVELIQSHSGHITMIGNAFNTYHSLDDSQIRMLFAQASNNISSEPGDVRNTIWK